MEANPPDHGGAAVVFTARPSARAAIRTAPEMRHIAASDAYPIAIFGGPSSALVCRRQRALLPDLLAVERAVAGVGGSLESFHFAFGGDDVYVMADAPDNAAAMAMAVAVGSSGAIDSYQTVVLLSPSEVDKAMSVAVDYTPPGS